MLFACILALLLVPSFSQATGLDLCFLSGVDDRSITCACNGSEIGDVLRVFYDDLEILEMKSPIVSDEPVVLEWLGPNIEDAGKIKARLFDQNGSLKAESQAPMPACQFTLQQSSIFFDCAILPSLGDFFEVMYGGAVILRLVNVEGDDFGGLLSLPWNAEDHRDWGQIEIALKDAEGRVLARSKERTFLSPGSTSGSIQENSRPNRCFLFPSDFENKIKFGCRFVADSDHFSFLMDGREINSMRGSVTSFTQDEEGRYLVDWLGPPLTADSVIDVRVLNMTGHVIANSATLPSCNFFIDFVASSLRVECQVIPDFANGEYLDLCYEDVSVLHFARHSDLEDGVFDIDWDVSKFGDRGKISIFLRDGSGNLSAASEKSVSELDSKGGPSVYAPEPSSEEKSHDNASDGGVSVLPDRVLGIADRECTIFEVSDRRVRFGCKGTLVRHSDSFAFSYSGIEVPAMRTEASALSHFGTWENLALEWQGPAVTDEALLSVQLLDRMGRIIALSTDKKSLPACHSVLEMETLYFKCDDPPDFSNGDVFEIRHESSIVLRQGFPRLSPSTVWFFVKWDLVRHWKFKTIQILLRDTRGNLVATSAGESAISSTQSNSSADGRCYLFVSRGKIHVGCENVQFLDKLSVVVDDGSGGNNTTMISCKVSDIYSSTWGRFSLKWTRRQPLPPPSLLTVRIHGIGGRIKATSVTGTTHSPFSCAHFFGKERAQFLFFKCDLAPYFFAGDFFQIRYGGVLVLSVLDGPAFSNGTMAVAWDLTLHLDARQIEISLQDRYGHVIARSEERSVPVDDAVSDAVADNPSCFLFSAGKGNITFCCEDEMGDHSVARFFYNDTELTAMNAPLSDLLADGPSSGCYTVKWVGPNISHGDLVDIRLLLDHNSTPQNKIRHCHFLANDKRSGLLFSCDTIPVFAEGDTFDIRYKNETVVRYSDGDTDSSNSESWFFVEWDFQRHGKMDDIQIFLNDRYGVALAQSVSKATAVCSARFLRYESSSFEAKWISNIRIWKDFVCEKMAEHSEDCESYFSGAKLLLKNGSAIFDSQSVSSEIFSKFIHTISCSYADGRVVEEIVTSWIEPLVGYLRHPLCCKSFAKYGNSTEAFVPFSLERFWAGAANKILVDSQSQSTLFDISVGLLLVPFKFLTQKKSTELGFFKNYNTRGVNWTRIVGWEGNPVAKRKSQKQLEQQSPGELLSASFYQFYNFPIDADPASPRNPLNILRTVAKPNDFVVFKLSLGDPDAALRLLRQVAENDVSDLIDEIFFKLHISERDIGKYFWGDKASSRSSLVDVYNLALHLRKSGGVDFDFSFSGHAMKTGVRVHGWV